MGLLGIDKESITDLNTNFNENLSAYYLNITNKGVPMESSIVLKDH